LRFLGGLPSNPAPTLARYKTAIVASNSNICRDPAIPSNIHHGELIKKSQWTALELPVGMTNLNHKGCDAQRRCGLFARVWSRKDAE
jgi:hypothetical protein